MDKHEHYEHQEHINHHEGGDHHHERHHEELPEGDEYADLEAHAKEKKHPPKQRRYRIRINKDYYNVNVPAMTGRELLELAKKTPVEQYQIRQKIHGELRPIGLNETVNFCTPGIERFQTIAIEQREG